ncbi:MAG: ABC-F family ATP-binding cassette domain-containing protein [Clostridia bacterium]|nr:ABC-F family ATP-binding cassette domain-containing protein [Clostridia bacterium]
MSIITASKLNKSFGIESVLEDVTFHINAGDRIGIVGANGAGKSTLMRILAGELAADDGDLYYEKGTRMGYLKQRDHFPDGGTVREEVAKAASPEQKAHFEEVHGYSYEKGSVGILRSLAFTDDYFDKPVGTLSGGERTRLAMASLLLQEPDILLLDEPTNHLDIGTLKWLEGYLKNCRSTLVIISHDRYFLDRVVTRIFEIENRRLNAYEGNYTTYKEKKQLRYEQDLRHYEQQRAEIARQEEIIRRFKEHNTEHLVKRAQSREKRLAQLEPIRKPALFHEKLHIRFEEKLKSGTDVLQAEDLAMSFPAEGGGRKPLFAGVSMDIKKGDRICMVGPNGVGKTTLLKIILGELVPDSGWLRLGQNVLPGYYDQEQQLLDMNKTVLDEIHSTYIKYDQVELRKLLGRLGFYGDDVFKQVKDLAGGEKAKLSLLKLMMTGANFLILDEPTNHLDIAAKEVFEDALMEFPGTLLIVSHDRYLLQKIPTAIYELGRDGITVYLGSYDYYEQKSSSVSSGKAYLESLGKAAGAKDPAAALTKEERIAQRAKEKEEAAEKRKKQRRLELAEEMVQKGENRVTELENLLCLPEIFSDPEKARKANSELLEAKAQLEEYYEAWMALQEEL